MHSGDCIHDPKWKGTWDQIVVEPVITEHFSDHLGSKPYKIVSGYPQGRDAWVCDNCANRPGYFADYLLFKLSQLNKLEEGVTL